MAIYKGNKKVVAVYKGSTPINKIYKGSTLVFQTGGGSQSVPVVITFTDDSDPAKRQYIPVCEGATKTATSQTIELPSESETYNFVNKDTLLEVRNYSNNCPSVTSLKSLFSNAGNIKTLTFAKGMDTSKIKSIYNMFYNCSSLVSLDLSSFDTSNVTDASYLFSGCSSLTSLNISSFDTSSITNASYLFKDCSKLVSLDLSNWNTSSITNASSLFRNCRSLVSLDLSNFDMSKATSYNYMFTGCTSLSTIKCKQSFKDWCNSKKSKIGLTNYATINWEIVD